MLWLRNKENTLLTRGLMFAVFIAKPYSKYWVIMYIPLMSLRKAMSHEGVQWLSGRVLDSRPRGRELEPQRRHCIVSLSKTH